MASLLSGAPQDTIREMGQTLADLLAHPPLELTPEDMARAASWEEFCDRLVRIYQELALAEVGSAPLVREDLLTNPELWS